MEINMFESGKEKYSTGLAIDVMGKLISIGSCSDTNLIIPNNVKEISNGAFKNNNEIESIVISDSVEIIGWHAFEGCASLRNIMLGKNVERIGNSAFKDCVTLETIEIPDSIKSIGDDAFSGCKSLEYNEEYSDYGTMYYLGNKTNNYLYLCSVKRSIHLFDEPKKKDVIVDINRQCRIIGGGAFREYEKSVSFLDLTSVAIPDGVIEIRGGAFSECSNLTSVTIGKNVERIGEGAFSCCDNLRKIYFNSEKCTSVGDKAFSCNMENKLGVDIYINDDIKELPYKFLNCFKKRSNICGGKEEVAKVNSLHLGKGITDIKEAAFESFNGLTYIVIGENVKTIGERCFNACEIRNIVLPDSVEYIGRCAFDSSLLSITLGKGIKKIDECAFSHCRNLSHVNYMGSINDWCQIEFCDHISNPIYRANSLYINGQLITEANITTATKINDYTFYGCESLTSIVIGDSVTSIGQYTFHGCESLTSIVIGDSVTSIGEDAFAFCRSLTSVVIGKNVTSIGSSAFHCCSNLTSIEIPNSVTSIGDSAFYNCASLESINYLGTIDSWVQISFDNYYSNPLDYAKKLYINNELVTEEDLKIATKKNNFVVKKDSLKEIDVSQNKDEEICTVFDEFENVDANKNNYKVAEDNDEKRNFKSKGKNKKYSFLRVAIIVGVIVVILLKVKDCIVATL